MRNKALSKTLEIMDKEIKRKIVFFEAVNGYGQRSDDLIFIESMRKLIDYIIKENDL